MNTSKTPAAVILLVVATIASILQSPLIAGHPKIHAALEALAGVLTIVATVFAKPLTGTNASTATVTTTVTADPAPDARTKQ